MKNNNNLKSTAASTPKAIVVLTLAAASIAMVMPDATNAYVPDGGKCTIGDRGDCEELTSSPGTMVCTEGIMFNDCH